MKEHLTGIVMHPSSIIIVENETFGSVPTRQNFNIISGRNCIICQ